MRILSLHTSSLRKTEDSSQAGGHSLSFYLSQTWSTLMFFSDGVVSVESCPGSSGWPETLKLLEGPGYQPSYAR